jgi:Zn-dependent protease
VIALFVIINMNLAVFNLLPVPPLDGSKIMGIFLPDKAYFFVLRYERYVMLALMLALWSNVLDRPLAWLNSGMLEFIDYVTRPVDWIFRAIL